MFIVICHRDCINTRTAEWSLFKEDLNYEHRHGSVKYIEHWYNIQSGGQKRENKIFHVRNMCHNSYVI